MTEALQAALADPSPSRQTTLALLVVAAEQHRSTSASLDELLSKAMRRARAAGTSGDLVGQAAGG